MAVALVTGCAKKPETRGAVELRGEARLAERPKSSKVAVGTLEGALNIIRQRQDAAFGLKEGET